MPTQNLFELLEQNRYPGRGILLGRSADGARMVVAYFIMGRSENSRNRVFVTDGEVIRTEAHDPAKLSDPSLIIYAPVRVFHGEEHDITIVTNGDQTDTIYEGLENGLSFAEALRSRTFEPDAPNFTPRISGAVEESGYLLSILKSAAGDPASVQRQFFEYPNPLAGQGHLIHTYRCDGNPIPSFEGEPKTVSLDDSGIDEFAAALWESLNEDNKVSLFVRYLDIETGDVETRIINKYAD